MDAAGIGIGVGCLPGEGSFISRFEKGVRLVEKYHWVNILGGASWSELHAVQIGHMHTKQSFMPAVWPQCSTARSANTHVSFHYSLTSWVQVCGDAEVWGDGIVPVPSAHLEGAINVDIEGAYHSPLGSSKVRHNFVLLAWAPISATGCNCWTSPGTFT